MQITSHYTGICMIIHLWQQSYFKQLLSTPSQGFHPYTISDIYYGLLFSQVQSLPEIRSEKSLIRDGKFISSIANWYNADHSSS